MASFELADVASIQRDLNARKGTFESLSDWMLGKLLMLKVNHPKTIRVVFSRQPRVKDVNGILRKIELLRANNPSASITDVNDVIALTILCPYESDIELIYDWIKDVLDISPSFKDGARNSSDGHRGYHFSIRLLKPEVRAFPDFRGLSCELQIKTILEEAFDAKSHDFAYKPQNLKVGQQLKNQFLHLSTHLRALDGQSEFLKDLILREKREIELRRRACLQMYLSDCGDVPKSLGLNLAKLPELVELMDVLDRPDLDPSKDMCKFAAYCSISLDNIYLGKLAIDLVEQYIKANVADPRKLFGRSALHWVLGNHELALADMYSVISETERGESAEEIATTREAKNNFVYFTCDWQIFSYGVPEATSSLAAKYAQDLAPGSGPEELDTLGLYQIIFSNSVREIDQGRLQLSDSLARRTKDQDVYEKFFELHQFIAINRMMKLMTEPTV
jgi:ppGpp synthetase/RelA/SpoT-type nucleotidyltranferase